MDENETRALEEQAAALAALEELREEEEAELRAALAELEALRLEDELRAREAERRGYIADAVLGAYRGVNRAVSATLDAVNKFDDWLSERFGQTVLTTSGFKRVSAEEFRAGKRAARTVTEAAQSAVEQHLEALPEADTAVGGITEGVMQWAVGMAGAARAFKALGLLQGAGKFVAGARGALASSIGSGVTFKAEEDNLADLIQRYPALANPVTAYLAGDEDDSEAEGRLKNSLADLLPGVALEGLVHGLRVLRAARRDAKAAAENTAAPSRLEPVDEPPPASAADEPAAPTGAAAGDSVAAAADTATAPVLDSALLTRPEAARVLADAIEAGRAGKLSEAVNDLLGKAADQIPTTGRVGGINAAKIEWSALGENAGDVANLLDTVEAAYAEVIARAGADRVSVETTRKLADKLATDFGIENVANLYADTAANGGQAARLLAAHSTLLDAANSIAGLAKKIKSGAATDIEKAELAARIETFAALHSFVRGATAETARAMRNLRELRRAQRSTFAEFVELAREIGLDPEQRGVIERLAAAETSAEITKVATRSVGKRLADAWLELFYNGLLSSPVTWTVNTVSGALKVAESLIERPTAAALGYLRRRLMALTGRDIKGDRGVVLGEVRAQVFGIVAGLRIALRAPFGAMADAIRRAPSVGAREAYEAFLKETADEWGSVWRVAAGGESAYGKRAEVLAADRRAIVMDAPEDARTFVERAQRGIARLVVNPVGKVIRLPSRVIATTDELFKAIAHEQERYALAYREADYIARTRPELVAEAGGKEALIKAILDGKADDATLNRIAEEADAFARYQTYTTELDGVLREFQGLIGRVPLLRILVPFVRTPANIFTQAIGERTPLGLASARIRRQLADPGAEGDLARARMVLGTSALITAMFASRDVLRGSGRPGRNSEDFDGVAPYSLKLGGKWFQFNRLEPMGMVLGLAADIRDLMDNATAQADPEADDSRALAAFKAAAIAVVSTASSKTFLTGLTDLVEFLDDPERHAERFFASVGFALLVPYSSALRNFTRATDPVVREAWDVVDRIRAQLPGASEALPVRRDYLGRPVTHRARLGPELFSPLIVSELSDDPLDLELARLRFSYSMPRRKIAGVELTPSQYSRLLELRGQTPLDATGRTMEDALRELIESDEYRSMAHDEARIFAVKRIVERYTEAAVNALLNEDAELRAAVERAKLRAEQLRTERRADDAQQPAVTLELPEGASRIAQSVAEVASALGLGG